ncbi:MAG TPA: alpha/beta fold hydrolase [Gammaproteobacteria bacterium]|nr:alpha/beta fold hydrolase [Gammaproteobacteria bacterium]
MDILGTDHFIEPGRSRRERALVLDGPAGELEAVLSHPPVGATSQALAVVCHPHPLHQGSLHNKVTLTLARALSQMGVPALRFNFRGVGQSAGSYGGGAGEVDDLLSILEQLRERYPDRALWVAGFSFGAYVALRAAQAFAVDRLITVAPPINLFDFSTLEPPGCPWLVVQGTDDELVPAKAVLRWSARTYPAPEVAFMDGACHYFHRRLQDLRTLVEERVATDPALCALPAQRVSS